MFNLQSYWFLVFGILLMLIMSIILIVIIKSMLDVRDVLLEDKSITIKGKVDEKIRNIDSDDGMFSKMDVIVLIADKFRLSLNIYSIEDYLKYSEGDIVLLKVDNTGSIEPLKIIEKG